MTLILLKNKGQYVFSSFFYFILVLWSSILKFMIEVRDISPLGIVLQIFSQFVLFFDFSFEIFCLDLLLFRRRPWHPTPILLPGKSHGRRSLVGCSPWGHEESDTAEPLHFHFSLSCIGEGNDNPTPLFLPGESQGWGSLVGCHLWGRTESDTTEAT